MSTIKRITVFVFAALIFAANLPLCACAVDPVSAATMANALAQAITAYGASQGVSMTFDVIDTDGIGQGVHDLWDQFVADVNNSDTPTYDSLAVTMWSNLYSKIGNNLGITISASEMPFIDSFWNWLLSGPAEMTKVDNQYFEWTIDQNTGVVAAIPVLSVPDFGDIPVKYLNIGDTFYVGGGSTATITSKSKDAIYYFYQALSSDVNGVFVTVCSVGAATIGYKNQNDYPFSQALNLTMKSDGSDTNAKMYCFGYTNYNQYVPDVISSNKVNIPASYNVPTTITQKDALTVRPYIGDAAPQNVYIPDNTDVNYNPTDVAIPLDISWDNTLFGDGDGTLTDAQSEAAAAAADDAITDSVEKTLTIADTANPDIPAPGEVYVPFLPVELPSFNFNLSGIWHYVREWITSLGAWFATVLTVWASLPYAMVVPVYATLVIVIVLGVYKRFFM